MRHFFFCLFLFLSPFFTRIYAQECLSLPLEWMDGKPIILATLNDQPVALLLDTGSDLTILHTRAARRLGFQARPLPASAGQVKGIGGVVNGLTLALEVDLRIADQQLFTNFVSTDLSKVDPRFSPYKKRPLVGIFGADLMQRYGLVIDYEGGWVQLHFDGTETEGSVLARQ